MISTRLAAGLVTCALLGAGLVGCVRAHQDGAPGRAGAEDEKETELDVRDVAGEAKVSLGDALRAALDARPGTAVEAQLEGEVADGRRRVFFEVMIVGADGGVSEVTLDPATGSVLRVEAEKDAEEAREIRAAAAAIPSGAASLAEAVKRAEAATGARAVEAKIEVEKGRCGCEITLLEGRRIIEADVGLTDGTVRVEDKSDEENEDGDDEDDETDEKDAPRGR